MTIRHLKYLAVCGLVAGLAACAYQPSEYKVDSVQDDTPPETRTITGSRIPQEVDPDEKHPRTRIPVTIITRDDIDRSGAISVGGALKNHPAIWGVGGR